MKELIATATFILDNNAKKLNKKGKYPIKLSIYYGEGKKRYGTKTSATEDEWKKLNSSKLRDKNLKQTKEKLEALLNRANNIISELDPFSIVSFEERFYDLVPITHEKHKTSLAYWFEKHISNLKANDQIGSAISYRTTLNSINKFRSNLAVHDISPNLLNAYESYLLKSNKSITTVGIYMRQLRAVINLAIENKSLSADQYPFKKYTIPAGRNIKKALSPADIKKLINYKTDDFRKQKAIDFWLFSYLCNGINFTDIAHPKTDNVSPNFIHYIRQKTKRTKKKDLSPIKVALSPLLSEIIERQKNTDQQNPFLFPILEPGMNAVTIKHRCQRFIKWVNKHMNEIRLELSIESSLNTYAARHSFSTMLKRKGVSTSYIKEALGHSSEATTEHYLDSFSDEVKTEYANLLTDF